MHSLPPPESHYNVTMEEDDNKFKITCQRCNDILTFSGGSGDLLYINFLYAVMSTLGLYPEDLVPENYYFK